MVSNRNMKKAIKSLINSNVEWVDLGDSRHTLCYVVHHNREIYLHSYVLKGVAVIKCIYI